MDHHGENMHRVTKIGQVTGLVRSMCVTASGDIIVCSTFSTVGLQFRITGTTSPMPSVELLSTLPFRSCASGDGDEVFLAYPSDEAILDERGCALLNVQTKKHVELETRQGDKFSQPLDLVYFEGELFYTARHQHVVAVMN